MMESATIASVLGLLCGLGVVLLLLLVLAPSILGKRLAKTSFWRSVSKWPELEREGDGWRGIVDGLPIEVLASRQQASPTLRISKLDLRITAYTLHSLAPRYHKIKEVRTGDATLDEQYTIAGDPLAIFALLDAQTRRLFKRFSSVPFHLENGRLEAELGYSSALMPWGIKLAKCLLPREELSDRLKQNIQEEPDPLVRRQLLKTCLDGDGLDLEEQRALALVGIEDGDPICAALGAIALGPEGEPKLQSIVLNKKVTLANRELVVDEMVSHECASALEFLLGKREFLNSPELEGAVEKAARAIVRVSKSDAEEMLLQLLEWEHISAIAVELLARVGTVQAVEHLLPLADAWLTKPRRRAAAKAAIQAIQARLGDVDEGRLSVAPVEDEGGLSVAANRSSPLKNG
ncbi:MAG: hypothetical protein HN348_25985 [Proteobacteria bacterium]|jgi:hypothetical protein|nr:hypothetical protein [Pseudomonadota bacterium]